MSIWGLYYLRVFLTELDLSSCLGIHPQGFYTLGRLVKLEWISLYRTQITDSSLRILSEYCQHLVHVNLGSCIGIQNMDEGLELLVKNNP